MQLLSMNLIEKVESFLHAGYVSGYPRPLFPEAYPLVGPEGYTTEPSVQLDLVQALQLGEPTSQDAGPDAAMGLLSAAGGSEGGLLLGALVGTGLLALLVVMYRQFRAPAWKAAPVLFSMLMMAGIFQCCGDTESSLNADSGSGDPDPDASTDDPPDDPLPDDPPWEGVTVRSYASPQQATLTILHGIIAPGLSNLGRVAQSLPNIQNEVGLPVQDLTEGMAYALQTYGLDGWGNEFRMEPIQWGYVVTSAGQDGSFDTPDDISHTIYRTSEDGWGFHRYAFFMVKDTAVKVIFHRFNGEMFLYNNQAAASALTGGPLFDLFFIEDFEEVYNPEATLNAAYNAVADGLDHDPIILQVFE